MTPTSWYKMIEGENLFSNAVVCIVILSETIYIVGYVQMHSMI